MNVLYRMLVIASKLKCLRYGIKCGNDIIIKKGFGFYGCPSKLHLEGDGQTYIGPDSKVTCYGDMEIGTNFSATEFLRLTCLNKIKIGKNVLLGSSVTILDSNHGMMPLHKGGYRHQDMLLGEVVIEDGVWCGDHVLILPGASIGKYSIIGAGSVVTKAIPEYCIAVGNPCKVIKRYNFEKNCWQHV